MDDDRAQLMLVGAITIAVIFLGLVAVLNTGLYTSNVAPRAGLSATADAETFVDSVEEDVPTLLGAAAQRNVDGEVYAFNSTIRDEIDRYGTYLLRSIGNERAATVGISVTDTTYDEAGLVVDDNASRKFAPVDGDPGRWTVAEDVRDLDGELAVYRFPVYDGTDDSMLALEATSQFDFDSWRLELYWDEEEDTAHVRSVDDSGVLRDCTLSQRQATNASGVTVDLTEGRVVGTDCKFPTVDNDSGLNDPVNEPYDVAFDPSNDPDTRGTYGLAVDGDIDESNVESNPTDVPYSVPRLDAVTLALQYTAPSLDYDTEIEVESDAVDLPPPPLIGGGTVYVNESSGYLRSVDDGDWGTRTYDANDTERIGPADIDFDADGRVEIPYVNDSGEIRLIDATNESTTLPSGEIDLTGQSRLAVGTWNGSPVSVFYAGNGTINRTTPGARAPVRLNATATGDGVRAPVGPTDVDNDGSREFVYVDGSEALRYIDGADDTDPEQIGNDGLVSGAAVGPAHDFDTDGYAEVPFVDEDGNVSLINGSGDPIDLFEKHDITNDEPVDDTPLAVRDVNGDGDMEIVYLRGGQTYYLENVGTGAVVERRLPPEGDLDNSTSTSTINASDEQGVV